MRNVIHKALYALLLCSTSIVSLWAMHYSDPYESGYEPKTSMTRSLEEIQKEREEHSTRLNQRQIHDILYDPTTPTQDTQEDDENQQQFIPQKTSEHIALHDKPNISPENVESYSSKLLEEFQKARLTDTTTSDENLLARIIEKETPEIADFSKESQQQIVQLFFKKLSTRSISDRLQQSSDSMDQLLQKSSDLTTTKDEFQTKTDAKKTTPTETNDNPFSLKTRFNKFTAEFWKGNSWKNFTNLFRFEKNYVKTVIADALAGDTESVNLFGSKKAKEYIRDTYSSAEKRELVTAMSKKLYDEYQKQLVSSKKQTESAESLLIKNQTAIDKKLTQDIQTIQTKLARDTAILRRVKALRNDPNTAYPVSMTIMYKIKSEFNLTLDQATDYAYTGTAESEFDLLQKFATKKIAELKSNAQEAKQQLQSEFDMSVFIPKMKQLQENIEQLKSIGTHLSNSLNEICNNDQIVITTYDRRIENDIINFVDFSTFTFDTNKTFEENMNQLISDQNLNVPVHQAQGKDQFYSQLREAMIKRYAPKYADMLDSLKSNETPSNVVPTILKLIPNFELFPEDLQNEILRLKNITLDDAQQADLTKMKKETISINETQTKAAALLEPQHFST